MTVPFTDRNCACRAVRLHLPARARPSPPRPASWSAAGRGVPDRRVHVVADAAYKGPAWRDLPASVTFTTRLASNAVLYAPAPPRTGRRGRPALKGARLGTPPELAATATWTPLAVTRYRRPDTTQVAVIKCLWYSSLRYIPVQVVLVRDPASAKPYGIALVSTDLSATPAQLIARYADRWSIEQAIKDGKDLLGVGQAHNRLQTAVERTVPFGMLTLTILTCWYHQAGQSELDINTRRTIAPWYRHKRSIAVIDMLAAFRRARITATTAGQIPRLNHTPLAGHYRRVNAKLEQDQLPYLYSARDLHSRPSLPQPLCPDAKRILTSRRATLTATSLLGHPLLQTSRPPVARCLNMILGYLVTCSPLRSRPPAAGPARLVWHARRMTAARRG